MRLGLYGLAVALTFSVASAWADCSSPLGYQGSIEWFPAEQVHKYCDDTDTWNSLGGSGAGGGYFDRVISGTASVIVNSPTSSISFTTDGVERMTVLSNGNVGVGTSTPSAALDVSGNVLVGGVLTLKNPYGNSSIGFNTNAASGNNFVIFDNNEANLYFGSYPTTGGYLTSAIVRRDIGTWLFVSSTRVGSTASPIAKLDVTGTISSSDAIQVGSSSLACSSGIPGALRYNTGNIEVCNGTTWSSLGGGGGGSSAVSPTGAIQFSANGSGAFGGDASNLYWDNANKRLGVGTNAPSATLSILSSNLHRNIATNVLFSGGLQGLQFEDTDGSGSALFANAGYLYFYNRATSGNYVSSNLHMTLDPSGNVGIGTTNPTATLQVSGSLIVSTSAQGATSPSLYVGTNGNVGIGTNSPQSKLHINRGGSGNQEAARFSVPSGNPYITLGNDITSGNGAFLLYDAANDVLRINTHGTVSGLYVKSTKVGVGTASPESYHGNANHFVVANTAGNAGLSIVSDNASDGNIYFADGAASSEPYRGVIEYEHANDAMAFRTAAAEKLRITSSGNVGIGTTDPSATLHVIGDIFLTGVMSDVSDRRKKKDITYLPDGSLKRIEVLKPATYRMRDNPAALEYGLIAQDVEGVFPDLVQTHGEGSEAAKSLNYIGLIAPMIKAMQELKADNDNLRAELKAANDNQADALNALRTEFKTYKAAHP